MGGRGSGKTRAGAEWVNGIANGNPFFSATPTKPIALIGETFADVREIMIDGPAGIRACALLERPTYEVTRKRLVWPNGVVAHAISAEDPESLRGPQFSAAWCDEIGKWQNAQECWDMLQFALRLGDWPRQMVTTTPRPIALLRKLIASSSTVTTRMRTADNADNLADGFLASVVERYGGSWLGRQELDGELLMERAGTLWTRAGIDKVCQASIPSLRRVVVAVDPPATSKSTSDACGIVVAGLDDNGIGWVIGDHSIQAATPTLWAARVAAAFEASEADAVVAEVNQGGDMVLEVLRTAYPTMPVKPVHATRSKRVRAEPVAALYEQNRVLHGGRFSELEDEMCDFGLDGLSSGRSPDRLDALVWALTELMLVRLGSPQVRPT